MKTKVLMFILLFIFVSTGKTVFADSFQLVTQQEASVRIYPGKGPEFKISLIPPDVLPLGFYFENNESYFITEYYYNDKLVAKMKVLRGNFEGPINGGFYWDAADRDFWGYSSESEVEYNKFLEDLKDFIQSNNGCACNTNSMQSPYIKLETYSYNPNREYMFSGTYKILYKLYGQSDNLIREEIIYNEPFEVFVPKAEDIAYRKVTVSDKVTYDETQLRTYLNYLDILALKEQMTLLGEKVVKIENDIVNLDLKLKIIEDDVKEIQQYLLTLEDVLGLINQSVSETEDGEVMFRKIDPNVEPGSYNLPIFEDTVSASGNEWIKAKFGEDFSMVFDLNEKYEVYVKSKVDGKEVVKGFTVDTNQDTFSIDYLDTKGPYAFNFVDVILIPGLMILAGVAFVLGLTFVLFKYVFKLKIVKD